MTQVAGMNSAPSSRIPMPKARQPNAYQNGYGQHKAISAPSKLEQMQMQYQQKLVQEKEKRMSEINQQTDQRARTFGAGNGTDDSFVRNFFQERRQMVDQGFAPNIDQHYSKKKAEATGVGNAGNYSTQYQQKKQFGYNSGRPPAHKNSAGRDKSKLLAPIDYGTKGQKSRKSSAASNGSYPTTYQRKQQPPSVRSLPPSRKTSVAGSGTTTPTGYQSNGDGNGDYYSGRRSNQHGDNYDNENRAAVLSSRNVAAQNKKISFKQWQNKQKRHLDVPTSNESQPQESPEKLTDFQKWQLEQDAEKSERLQKHAKANGTTNGYQHSPTGSSKNSPNKRGSPPSKNGGSSPGMVRHQKQVLLQKHINTQSKKHLYASQSGNISYQESSDEDDDNGGVDESMVRKQKELEAMIKRQQDELQKMKVQRAAEEEEARKAREQEAKRATQQRERQRRLKEAEEREHQEREQEERKEREKREMDKQDMKWMQEQKRAAEINSSHYNGYDQDNTYSKKSSRYETQDPYQDSYGRAIPSSRAESKPSDNEPYIPKKPTRVRSNKARRAAPPPPARELTPEPEEYYPSAEPASYNLDPNSEEAYQKVDTAPCKVCGRKFAKDRLAKHMAACKKTQKPRKKFDVAKMRTEGTELASYANQGKRRPDPPKKKNNWKKQHENFVATIRYAKQVTDAENAGTSLANLPPPPVTEEPDLVPCPHCNRTFNATAAERHIPRCKDNKTRPAPFRTNRK